jgi:hypothetical protein
MLATYATRPRIWWRRKDFSNESSDLTRLTVPSIHRAHKSLLPTACTVRTMKVGSAASRWPIQAFNTTLFSRLSKKLHHEILNFVLPCRQDYTIRHDFDDLDFDVQRLHRLLTCSFKIRYKSFVAPRTMSYTLSSTVVQIDLSPTENNRGRARHLSRGLHSTSVAPQRRLHFGYGGRLWCTSFQQHTTFVFRDFASISGYMPQQTLPLYDLRELAMVLEDWRTARI